MEQEIALSIYERPLTALEQVWSRVVASRMALYAPINPPDQRHDIICLCCGEYYRPDDVLDGLNMLICLTCIKRGYDGS